MPGAFVIHPDDNVATLLDDARARVELRGQPGETELALRAPIALGHKVALRPIAVGEAVMKFGVPIGLASRPIADGEWVHLHNCRSHFDERSGDFDPVTGTAQDTSYG